MAAVEGSEANLTGTTRSSTLEYSDGSGDSSGSQPTSFNHKDSPPNSNLLKLKQG